jgi:hypothetical protein
MLSRLVLIAAAINFGVYAPLLVRWAWDPIDHKAASEAAALIPGDAAVSATGRLGAHLSERRRILNFPTVGEADWIVVYRREAWVPYPVEKNDLPRVQREVRRYENDPAWEVVFDRADIVVLHRALPGRSRALRAAPP